MCAAVCQRLHMVERGVVEVERRRAVDATAAAVAHCGVLDRAFLGAGGNRSGAAPGTGRAGESGDGDVVGVIHMPTS